MTTAKKYPRSTRRKDALHLVARAYAGANLKKPRDYWDDTLSVAWGDQDNYLVSKQLGKGKYGEVFASTNVRSRDACVIKIMRPVKEHRLRREIKILQHVRGGPNIVTLLEVVRDPDTKTPCFVFELVDAIGFRELQAAVTDYEVRLYTYQLLRALDFCHSKGIMHRDVKPGNVLIDHARKELRLIDWGLADFYHPGKEYPVRVATRFYKGPELLVDLRDYDYSLDVWGTGCMLAALLFKRPVFFRGEDEFDQLVKISKVLGSEELHRYCDKYGIDLDPRLDQLVGVRPRVPWRKFVTPENSHLCSPEAFDLLDKILRYDHHERLTCAEAMAHPYFAPVRAAAAAASAAPSAGVVPINGGVTAAGGGSGGAFGSPIAAMQVCETGPGPSSSAAAAAAGGNGSPSSQLQQRPGSSSKRNQRQKRFVGDSVSAQGLFGVGGGSSQSKEEQSDDDEESDDEDDDDEEMIAAGEGAAAAAALQLSLTGGKGGTTTGGHSRGRGRDHRRLSAHAALAVPSVGLDSGMQGVQPAAAVTSSGSGTMVVQQGGTMVVQQGGTAPVPPGVRTVPIAFAIA